MDQDCRNRIISEDYHDFIINTRQAFEASTIVADSCINIVDCTFTVIYSPITLTSSEILLLYGYNIIPNCYGLMDIGSIEASSISQIRNTPTLNLRGQGVLIGFVDTGIDYTHDAFKKADGTSKILSIWDQTIISDSPPGNDYFGTEYTQEQINMALASDDPLSIVPSMDVIGHGTNLAGVAAGTISTINNFSGVAPDAELVVVKLKYAKQYLRNFYFIPEGAICYQENDIMLGIKYLIDIADKYQRSISICVGLGTSQGAHDENSSSLSIYLSSIATQTGVAVVVAAGNEGNRGHHFHGSVPITSPNEVVELRVGPNDLGFSMEIWGDPPNTFSIDMRSPSGEYIPRIPARIGESRVLNFFFERSIVFVDVQIVESQTGAQLVLVRFQDPAEGIWRFNIYRNSDLELHYHIWLPISNFISDDTYFLTPYPYYTLTSPGNTVNPIVVTAYDYSNGSLYLNASRGYSRSNVINPNLAAPGVNIITSTLNNGYTNVTGTSVSAAHTAGVAAMLLEWGNVKGNFIQIGNIHIKNLLLRGAKRNPNISYPNTDWGYGILDLYNTFITLRGAFPS